MRAKVAAARSVLTPAVLGARIMSGATAAQGILHIASQRLYSASYWLRVAAYRLHLYGS